MRINNHKHIIYSENIKYNFMLPEAIIGINNAFFVRLLIYYSFKEYSKYMSLLQIILKKISIDINKHNFLYFTLILMFFT